MCLCHLRVRYPGSRKATGTGDWAEARRIAEISEKADSWSGRPKPQPVTLPAAAEPTRITIAEMIRVYLATRDATVAYPTYRKYKPFTTQFQAFADLVPTSDLVRRSLKRT